MPSYEAGPFKIKVKKTTDTTQDEDERGNTTIRETERFAVCIKTLSKDGEIRVLSGA